jgi:WD40 repeat protein/tRNA A-37 threonylcarbamoyl transferase component Bud32
MADSNDAKTSAGDPLDAIIADYVQQVEAGAVPDREALLAAHPDLADRLHAFFADFDRLDRQAGELRLSADPNRTTDATAPAGDELPRVRYFGDYELLEVIARGGMGVVYKARQVSLNRLVALKMILKGELATERDVARFRAEAEAAANLDHPHIVPIYEVGDHDGQQYYAMRFVEGTSLARHPRADARTEASLIAIVAAAVHHAHLRGILHRDLKPSNILIDSAGTPFVADFGLAKRVDSERSLTESGALVGTPRYMAPEQAAGRKDLTVGADVYSLGVVLYERITGQTPFTGETALEVLRQVRENEPPRPSLITPGCDRDLETICLKCLEKEADKRFRSAEALADDLGRWQRGEPIEARPMRQLERSWRWCRRHPMEAMLATGLVLALLGGLSGVTFQWLRAEDNAEQARLNELKANNHAAQARIQHQQATEERDAAETAKNHLRHNLYTSDMALIQAAWDANNLTQVLALLERHRPQHNEPDLRGFEWYYWKRLCHSNIRTLDLQIGRNQYILGRAGKAALGTAFPRKRVDNDYLIMWETSTEKELRTVEEPGYYVHSPQLNPDRSCIAALVWKHVEVQKQEVPADCELRTWEAATSKTIWSVRERADHLVFDPIGEKIATSGNGPVKVWDAMTGRLRLTIPFEGSLRANALAFSPDGTRLALTVGRFAPNDPPRTVHALPSVNVYDVAMGNRLLHFQAHAVSTSNAQFSPNGKLIATAGFSKSVDESLKWEIRLWDALIGKEVLAFLSNSGPGIAFSHDSKRIALFGGDSAVRVFDTASGQEIFAVKLEAGEFIDATFDCNDQRLFTLERGKSDPVPAAAQAIGSLGLVSPGAPLGYLMQFSVALKFLGLAAHADVTRLKVWDATAGRIPLSTRKADNRIALLLHGTRVIEESIEKGEANWERVFRIHDPVKKAFSDVRIEHADWARSPCGKFLATWNSTGEVRVWDVNSWQTLHTVRIAPRSRVTLSPNATHLLAWVPSGLKILEVKSGRELLALRGQFLAGSFTPDGALLATWDSNVPGPIRLWDTSTWRELGTIGEAAWRVHGVTFSPDGKKLATSGFPRLPGYPTAPWEICIWKLDGAKRVFGFPVHCDYISGPEFSPDEKRLVASVARNRGFAGLHWEVKMWDVETGAEVLSIEDNPWEVKFSADGNRLILLERDNSLRFLDASRRAE